MEYIISLLIYNAQAPGAKVFSLLVQIPREEQKINQIFAINHIFHYYFVRCFLLLFEVEQITLCSFHFTSCYDLFIVT
jgi:hypothetical protein